jgi:formate/nitrite transporter FocA (FNT family)
MRYPAKKDLWAVCLIALIVLAFIGFGIFFMAMPARNATSVGGGILFLLVGLFFLWTLLATTLEITSSHVVIRWGPLRWRIRIDEVVEAVSTSSVWLALGGTHVRFALSADAVLIKYRKKNGKKWLGFIEPAVLISPQDKTGFLQVLAEASPNLEQSGDGSVRLPPEFAG